MKQLLLVFVVGAVLFTGACRPTRLAKCDEEGLGQKWDEDHRDVACYAGMEEKYDLKEKEDHSGYTIIYSNVTWADMERQLNDAYKKLHGALNYENEDDTRFIDFFGLREQWTHVEDVILLRLSMVRGARLHALFEEWTNQASLYEKPEVRNGYNIKKIMLRQNPAEMFSFVLPEIELAKINGKLEKTGEHDVRENLTYGRKEKDQNHPNDPNSFIWKPEAMELHLVSYRIKAGDEKPEDGLGNYVEGWRVTGGKRESKPALLIFLPANGMAIVIIDSKREGKPGFGLPDFVDRMAIASLKEVAQNADILLKLFPKEDEGKKTPPRPPQIVIEISPFDGKPRDVWEEKRGGWPLPVGYRIGPKNDNYEIRIDFKKPKDPNQPVNEFEFRDIENIVKVWMMADYSRPSTGNVWEYYRPKAQYAANIKAQVLDGRKKVQFDFANGRQEIVTIVPSANDYIEDKPYAIAVTEGKARYLLQEKNAGSGVFDKRRIISVTDKRVNASQDVGISEADFD